MGFNVKTVVKRVVTDSAFITKLQEEIDYLENYEMSKNHLIATICQRKSVYEKVLEQTTDQQLIDILKQDIQNIDIAITCLQDEIKNIRKKIEVFKKIVQQNA